VIGEVAAAAWPMTLPLAGAAIVWVAPIKPILKAIKGRQNDHFHRYLLRRAPAPLLRNDAYRVDQSQQRYDVKARFTLNSPSL
jgi:hypothetical protein